MAPVRYLVKAAIGSVARSSHLLLFLHRKRAMRAATQVLCAVLAFAALPAIAQVPVPPLPDNGPTPLSPLGTPPGSSSQGTNESVSPMNGALSLYIPLLSLPQRGGYSLNLGFVHNSNLYSLQQQTTVNSAIDNQNGYGLVIDYITYRDSMARTSDPLEINLPRLQFSYEYTGDHAYKYSGSNQIYAVTNMFCAANFIFTDWSGNAHPFENSTACNSRYGGYNMPLHNVSDSSDGSYYRLDTSNLSDLQVISPDGTVYHFTWSNPFPNVSNQDYSFSNQENYYDERAATIVDTNGNTISIQTTYPQGGGLPPISAYK